MAVLGQCPAYGQFFGYYNAWSNVDFDPTSGELHSTSTLSIYTMCMGNPVCEEPFHAGIDAYLVGEHVSGIDNVSGIGVAQVEIYTQAPAMNTSYEVYADNWAIDDEDGWGWYYLTQTTSYVYASIPPPEISSYTTSGTPVRGGAVTVCVSGEYLTNAQTITIDGVGTASATAAGGCVQGSFSIPSNTSTGSHNLTVSTAAGTSNALTLSVGDPTPTITSISPDTWEAGDMTSVTIIGSGFGTNPSVTISASGTTVTITSASDTQIVANITVTSLDPDGAATIAVTSNGYNGSAFLQSTQGQSPASNGRTVYIQNTTRIRAWVLNPPVPNDGDAIIATQAFTLQIEAYHSVTNQRKTQVTGTVNISFEQGAGGETIPSQASFSQGLASAAITLKAVNGTSQTRAYTLNSGLATFTSAVNVWFSVQATKEGLVGGLTSCGHTISSNDHFVALPATGMCGTGVVIVNGGTRVTESVLEIGPWFPNSIATTKNPCVGSSDPYWNTTGVPRATTDSCSLNQAGIDLADGTFTALGLTGNGTVLWRFGN